MGVVVVEVAMLRSGHWLGKKVRGVVSGTVEEAAISECLLLIGNDGALYVYTGNLK